MFNITKLNTRFEVKCGVNALVWVRGSDTVRGRVRISVRNRFVDFRCCGIKRCGVKCCGINR